LQRIGIAYHNEFAPNQYFEIIPYFSNQFVDHPIFQTIRQENNNVGGEFRYVNSNSLFGKNNSFVAGFQPRYGNQRQQRFVNINGSIGALTQNYTAKTTYFGDVCRRRVRCHQGFHHRDRRAVGLHGTRGDGR
jgi:iron complex outermembrane receptor protein